MRLISRVGLLLTVVLLMCPANAISHESDSPSLVTVTGEAQVKVEPDEVIITLGIETWDRDLSTVKSENDRQTQKLIDAVKQLGVESKHIQTSHISIEPRRINKYNSELRRDELDFIEYYVRKTIVVTVKNVDRFDELLSAVVVSGATHVHGVQFRTTELRKYRDQARALAIKAAKEKATDLAQELGQAIGDPHAITEYPTNWWSWYNHSWWGASGGGMMSQNVVQNINSGSSAQTADGISLGQISVNAKVNVSFRILNQ